MSNELVTSSWSDPVLYPLFIDAAGRLSKSGFIPKHFQGKPDDCFVALMAARNLGIDPVLMMQNTYVIGGTLGYKAQFVVALALTSGRFSSIDWRIEGKGADLVVTCIGLRRGLSPVEVSVSMATAIADGWTSNKKYQSMPEIMLRYRSATLLVRLYAPDVLMGLQTDHELEDQIPEEPEIVIAREAATGAARIAEVDAKHAEDLEAAKLVNAIRACGRDWDRAARLAFSDRLGLKDRPLDKRPVGELRMILADLTAKPATPIQDAEIVDEGGEE